MGYVMCAMGFFALGVVVTRFALPRWMMRRRVELTEEHREAFRAVRTALDEVAARAPEYGDEVTAQRARVLRRVPMEVALRSPDACNFWLAHLNTMPKVGVPTREEHEAHRAMYVAEYRAIETAQNLLLMFAYHGALDGTGSTP
jgi:hypothetical protein